MFPMLGWSQCPNLDFSMGNFTNWQCYSGSCLNGNDTIYPTQPIQGRHTIINAASLQQGQFYDEYCPIISKVPNGFNFVAKLGNDSAGAKVDGLEYSMTIDSTNAILIVHCAFVLQEPNSHALGQEPRCRMTMIDSSGNPVSVNTGCAVIEAPIPNIAKCYTSILDARDWLTYSYNLESLIGQTIKIYFETRDCTFGTHFGYAYIITECRPLTVELSYCLGASNARLKAPDGFYHYFWRRSSDASWESEAQSVLIANPVIGEKVTCRLTSWSGCSAGTLQKVITGAIISADFMFGIKDVSGHVNFPSHNYLNWYDTCSRTVTFVDKSIVYDGIKDGILWEIQGLPNVVSYDSLFTVTFPDPISDNPVEYMVRLTVWTENGCWNTFSQPITIYPLPKVKITGSTQLCIGNINSLIATPLRSKFASHLWSWDGTGHYVGDTLKINKPGVYCLASLDVNGCYAYDTVVVTPIKPMLQGVNMKHVRCWGEKTGMFSYSTLSGGQQPYQAAEWIVWRNGKLDTINILSAPTNPQFFLDLPAGAYTFYALDAEGCELRDTIRIQQPDTLDVCPTPQKTGCAKDNGEIRFKIIGGTPPYNLSLNENKTVKTIDTVIFRGLATGIYTAKVVDANGCKKEGVEVEVSALPQYTIAGKITCNNNPLSSVAVATNSSVHVCNSASSDTLGEYSLSIDSATTVILTPTLAGYEFTPASCTYIVTDNLFDVDFVAVSTVGVLEVASYELQVTGYEIYDMLGRKLYTSSNHFERGEAPSPLERAGGEVLPAGIYIIKIRNNKGVCKVVKFVKL